MSQIMGATLVFEGGVTSPDAVDRALQPWLEGIHPGPDGAWDPRGLSDARMTLRPHDTGFDVLTLRFSSTAFAADERGVLDRVDRWLILGAEHGAALGYLTPYGDQLVDPWLTDEVLVPLLIGGWARIEAGPYLRRLWSAVARPELSALDHRSAEFPTGAVVARGPWGILVEG